MFNPLSIALTGWHSIAADRDPAQEQGLIAVDETISIFGASSGAELPGVVKIELDVLQQIAKPFEFRSRAFRRAISID